MTKEFVSLYCVKLWFVIVLIKHICNGISEWNRMKFSGLTWNVFKNGTDKMTGIKIYNTWLRAFSCSSSGFSKV